MTTRVGVRLRSASLTAERRRRSAQPNPTMTDGPLWFYEHIR